ncbi:MAG: murein L,D-transpeptidase [Akkermansiaceae bacterium]|nr:murein L,D-transpeptidase [Akkermansiaceae bacterium]
MTSQPTSNDSTRARAAADRVRPSLARALKARGLRFGDPVYLRAFKEERQLEFWVREPGKKSFKLFRTYRIAAMSGKLGPKLREGDRQAPEGFYFVPPSRMNPASRFHLAFDLGFPNDYDQAHGRDGSHLMVHGNRVSTGCLAMTDKKIEQIYSLCDAALANGQPFFRVHLFPFRMTDQRMAEARGHRWEEFWKNLKEGYDRFERSRIPPNVSVREKRYAFD